MFVDLSSESVKRIKVHFNEMPVIKMQELWITPLWHNLLNLKFVTFHGKGTLQIWLSLRTLRCGDYLGLSSWAKFPVPTNTRERQKRRSKRCSMRRGLPVIAGFEDGERGHPAKEYKSCRSQKWPPLTGSWTIGTLVPQQLGIKFYQQ